MGTVRLLPSAWPDGATPCLFPDARLGAPAVFSPPAKKNEHHCIMLIFTHFVFTHFIVFVGTPDEENQCVTFSSVFNAGLGG